MQKTNFFSGFGSFSWPEPTRYVPGSTHVIMVADGGDGAAAVATDSGGGGGGAGSYEDTFDGGFAVNLQAKPLNCEIVIAAVTHFAFPGGDGSGISAGAGGTGQTHQGGAGGAGGAGATETGGGGGGAGGTTFGTNGNAGVSGGAGGSSTGGGDGGDGGLPAVAGAPGTIPGGGGGGGGSDPVTPGSGGDGADPALIWAWAVSPDPISCSPASGAAAGGYSVEILGTDLDDVTAVYFGATSVPVDSVDPGVKITVTAPPGAGTVNVIAEDPDGTGTIVNGFTFISAIPPQIPGWRKWRVAKRRFY